MNDIVVQALGIVVGGRGEPFDDGWSREEAVIRLDGSRFDSDALAGLDAFSHLEVVFQFHRADPDRVHTGTRRPRGNPDWPPVGIFAQRGKDRPNRIGVSRCRLLGVDGLDVTVGGLDAIEGTPVLDLKPYMREFGPHGQVVQPAWSTELMRDYY